MSTNHVKKLIEADLPEAQVMESIAKVMKQYFEHYGDAHFREVCFNMRSNEAKIDNEKPVQNFDELAADNRKLVGALFYVREQMNKAIDENIVKL